MAGATRAHSVYMGAIYHIFYGQYDFLIGRGLIGLRGKGQPQNEMAGRESPAMTSRR